MKRIAQFLAAALLAPVFVIVIGLSIGFGAALVWLSGEQE